VNQKVVQRLSQVKRHAGRRRQDVLLASVSVLAHLILLTVLPGFVVYVDGPRKLIFDVELQAAPGRRPAQRSYESGFVAAPGEAEKAQAILSTSNEASAYARPAAEMLAEGSAVERSSARANAAQIEADGVPGSNASGDPAALHADEATPISSVQPVAVPGEQAEVLVEPTLRQPAGSVTGSEAQSGGAGAAGGTSGETEERSLALQSSVGGKQEHGPGDTSPGAGEGEEDRRPEPALDGEAADETGTPGLSDGPSERELKLLSAYADVARRRIRSQARNPEHGGAGVVTFEFQVARDGHLIDVQVVRSSGYSNIDNDAVEATRAAFNDAYEKLAFPPEVTVASWVFVMSLEYPLY
jgi:protein TonB